MGGEYRPLILCGPSGVGKDTLLVLIKKDFPDAFIPCVSHATRKMRDGEEDGVNYHFVSRLDMEKMIEKGEFIEYVQVHGNFYGISVGAIGQASSSGKVCTLIIDIQGVEIIKNKTELNPVCYFIKPPRFDALKERLLARGTENEAEIETRLVTAQKELDYVETNKEVFDAEFVNDDLEVAHQQLKGHILKDYPHLASHSS